MPGYSCTTDMLYFYVVVNMKKG